MYYENKYFFREKTRIFDKKHIKKFNFTTHVQLKTTSNTILQFTTSIRINNYKITTIINSNALTNFMLINFVNKKKIFTRSKNDNYSFIIINDKTLLKKNKIMNLKTKSLSIIIQQYYEKNIFDVIEIIIHDVVLKLF